MVHQSELLSEFGMLQMAQQEEQLRHFVAEELQACAGSSLV
jgi:hypothetical protein